MLQFLFLFIIFLIFFIILLLSFPYHYALNFKFQEKLYYNFYLSFIFLKIVFKGNTKKQSAFIEIFNLKKELKFDFNYKINNSIKNKFKKIIKNKIKLKTDPEKKEKQNKSKNKFYFSMINRENLNHFFKFILEMIKILKFDYLKLNLIFSFDDPYYNGVFLAYFYTFKELSNYPDIQARVNWQEVMFEAEGSIGGKIIPLQIIWQFLKFIFSIKSLKFFWQLYQSNSKKG